jgi:hypothetical protein
MLEGDPPFEVAAVRWIARFARPRSPLSELSGE